MRRSSEEEKAEEKEEKAEEDKEAEEGERDCFLRGMTDLISDEVQHDRPNVCHVVYMPSAARS